ncbi:DHA2 family efflux MFS transporter permease subunit [Streptomyces sp. NA04227]|uniref:DHA2 family efflux MFS transporter permease subunit n=1 Tax=Streptomyces sp. NA04227 TaxID=2742136 RepID=UPI001591FA4F|nr:DHA2 family efflux MFS transporter permease subunit [Streptomyces sp. NA04227]QKW06583.1 DHA2 family efflux MFS transporter permease subunit [Streptomyces sp. NA04227]
MSQQAAPGVGEKTPAAAAAHYRRVFLIVAAGVAMSNLDLFVVNVALPDIATDFDGASLSSLSWVLNAYSVVFAALLVPAGSYADRLGSKRAYLQGVALFTVASVLCAVAPEVWSLVGFRVLQAVGAAMLIPSSLGILLSVAPPEQRPAAVRNWAAVSGLAAALGPVIGGALTELDWRWIFLINVPVGIAAVLAGRKIIADTPRRTEVGRVDYLGAVLLTLGIGALALGLVKGTDWGWGTASTLGTLAASVVLVALFTRRSASHPSPVFPLGLLKLPAMSPAMLANLVFAVAFSAMLLSATLWCQDVWGWSALETGLAISPGPMMVPLLTPYAGKLSARLGAGVVAAVGCVLFAVGIGWWIAALDVTDHDYVLGLLPGMLLTGVGVCFAMPTLIGAALSKVPPASFSTGSAAVTMARQTGGVIGVSGLVAVLGTPGPHEVADSFDNGWWFTAAVTLAAGLSCLLLLRATKPGAAPAAKPSTEPAAKS